MPFPGVKIITFSIRNVTSALLLLFLSLQLYSVKVRLIPQSGEQGGNVFRTRRERLGTKLFMLQSSLILHIAGGWVQRKWATSALHTSAGKLTSKLRGHQNDKSQRDCLMCLPISILPIFQEMEPQFWHKSTQIKNNNP